MKSRETADIPTKTGETKTTERKYLFYTKNLEKYIKKQYRQLKPIVYFLNGKKSEMLVSILWPYKIVIFESGFRSN